MQLAITPDVPSHERYLLIRELARGGMGRIWVAEDTRLSRRVAIKELLELGTTRALRFERELSLTSRLEHPSIVSIHDGGTWPDGKPFYVMRLVSGESLERVIARAKDVGERIALLPHGIAAVDALAYAHAQGIVHRDLKPDNVLVGEFGETVVIDWGLAKDLRAATPDLVDGPYRELAHGATVGGEVLGTPAYMPPEQALGDAVDERADVYALGAMLYHLVSGMRPHSGGSIDEVLANVISGPPPALASVAPGVPADLIAIVDKAMAREPADRYASARELAADLKRFARGQLVGAHRYTAAQLVRRWLRKHRTAVVVGALAAVALAGFAVVSVTRIVDEEQQAQDARRLAEDARRLAERNQAKAQSLLDFMLVDLRAKLEPIGRLELLESVALEARDYYRDQPDATSPNEQHQRALALHGVGRVLDAKGQSAAALAEHEAALAIHQRLAAADPTWRRDAAASSNLVGDALRLNGKSDAAYIAYRNSIAIGDTLLAEKPDDAAAMAELSRAHGRLADFYFNDRRDATAALAERRRALALDERLVAAAPRDLARQRQLVASQAGVADMLMHTGDMAGSEAGHRKTVALAEQLAQRDRDDAISQTLLADRYEELGGVLHNQGKLPAALGYYRDALAIRERLVAKDPTNAHWRSTLARDEMNVGQALDDQDDLAGALEHHRIALAELDKLLAGDASNVHLRGTHAFVQRLVGSLLLRQHRLAPAIAAFETGRATLEQLVSTEPTNQLWQRDLGYLYADLADALADQHRSGESLELRRQVVMIAQRLAARDPNNLSGQIDVVESTKRLAETLAFAGQAEPARDEFRRALALAEKLPSNPKWDALTAELRKRAGGKR